MKYSITRIMTTLLVIAFAVNITSCSMNNGRFNDVKRNMPNEEDVDYSISKGEIYPEETEELSYDKTDSDEMTTEYQDLLVSKEFC